jgi:hypothetical protein
MISFVVAFASPLDQMLFPQNLGPNLYYYYYYLPRRMLSTKNSEVEWGIVNWCIFLSRIL